MCFRKGELHHLQVTQATYLLAVTNFKIWDMSMVWTVWGGGGGGSKLW
jgi:hypothetical protein